jgi:hypothetical protein
MNYKGTMVSGDLQENTVTIKMDKPIILKAGEYVVIPIKEFQQQDKKCFHPLSYRLAKSDVNYECTLCGKFI